VDQVRAYLIEHKTITVAQVRDLFNTSRKYALALMEYLDAQGITKRLGDERTLR
jgi:selenocysteine-specific elongation factor